MFYDYAQNNSGGEFIINDGVTGHYVIIEANDAAQADEIAKSIGIYFDGVESGDDCDCCGDRWYRNAGYFSARGEEVPSLYGRAVANSGGALYYNAKSYIVVHYLNGDKDVYDSNGKIIVKR